MARNGSKLFAFTTLILLLALIAAREARAAAARPLRIASYFWHSAAMRPNDLISCQRQEYTVMNYYVETFCSASTLF
jgi:hypothetical protein